MIMYHNHASESLYQQSLPYALCEQFMDLIRNLVHAQYKEMLVCLLSC